MAIRTPRFLVVVKRKKVKTWAVHGTQAAWTYKPYSLKIAVFLPNEDYENITLIVKLKSLSSEEDFHNHVFVVVEEPFGEKNYEKFTYFYFGG